MRYLNLTDLFRSLFLIQLSRARVVPLRAPSGALGEPEYGRLLSCSHPCVRLLVMLFPRAGALFDPVGD